MMMTDFLKTYITTAKKTPELNESIKQKKTGRIKKEKKTQL